MKAEEVRRTCTFIVTASSQAEGTATINHCSLAHTCDFMSSSYEKRNVSRKILKASHSSVLNNAVIPSITTSKKSFFAKSLSQSVMNEGRVEISVEQTRRFLRDKTGDTAEEHIQQFSIIESLFMELQRSDPSGVYYLKTRPLQYKVSGAAEMAHEFEALVVIPSAALHFYSSSRKMGSLDAAHLTSRFQGMMHALTIKDGADQIFQPIFAVMGNESNHSWEVDFVRDVYDDSELPAALRKRTITKHCTSRITTVALVQARTLSILCPGTQSEKNYVRFLALTKLQKFDCKCVC